MAAPSPTPTWSWDGGPITTEVLQHFFDRDFRSDYDTESTPSWNSVLDRAQEVFGVVLSANTIKVASTGKPTTEKFISDTLYGLHVAAKST